MAPRSQLPRRPVGKVWKHELDPLCSDSLLKELAAFPGWDVGKVGGGLYVVQP